MKKLSLTNYMFRDGRRFALAACDTKPPRGFRAKGNAKQLLEKSAARLGELAEMLYAQDRWGVLLVFQAMDAAGKDGAIKHVLSGVNPQVCQVFSFKPPSAEELDHDYLWRTNKALPERGRVGIFNRSYYEETIVVRVHPELLSCQKLPARLVTNRIWKERFEDINAMERYLARNGYVILKFFLHVSRAEQRRRFLDRVNDPDKRWKFSPRDVHERAHWHDYMKAYQDTIRHTATPHAPWLVIPADDKKFARAAVASAVIEALEGLQLAFPRIGADEARHVELARRSLERE